MTLTAKAQNIIQKLFSRINTVISTNDADAEVDSYNYVELVTRTASGDMEAIAQRMTDENINLLHAGMGMATEAGEFVDALKKGIFYGKPIDKVNLIEEIGDMMWYVGFACDTLGIDLNAVMQTNINKLRKRYPVNFTSEAALNRDLGAERELLEKAA